MYCKKCGNEIKEGEKFCEKCGTRTKNINGVLILIILLIILLCISLYFIIGKMRYKTKNINGVLILIILLIILLCISLYFIIGKNFNFSINRMGIESENNLSNTESSDEEANEFVQTSANVTLNNAERVSFENMSGDDENLSEIQKDIVSYFDNDYFFFVSQEAQEYPQVFRGAKITTTAQVFKVLKSTDEEFEVLAADCGGIEYSYYDEMESFDIDEVPAEKLFLISGEQLNERLTTGDMIEFYGRFIDVENKEIDGKTYMVSKIQAIGVGKGELVSETSSYGFTYTHYKFSEKFSFEKIKNIAEYIFGKDIKVNSVDSEDEFGESGYYKITLDNQSNANFKSFNIYKNNGLITYNRADNNLSENIQKRLFISADFQHYIVSTYDEGTEHVYIDYFDKDYNKLWNREFDYLSTKAFASPMDYNDQQMAVVIDNDLYLIDLETGENIIDPIIVGEKLRVNMMSDGIILIGDNNKDTIMKVDYTGKIVFKINADTSMSQIYGSEMQLVDGKLLIRIFGEDSNDGGELLKYIVLNNDGEVEWSSKDLASYVM